MNCIEARLKSVSRDSIAVELSGGETFVLPFTRYGYFRYCTIAELENVICDGFALEWPDAMIDLELELLRHPDQEGKPVSVEKWLSVREKLRNQAAIRLNASRAGKTKSARKQAASRRNGALGGRPRKKAVPVLQ